jgi:hypothetical protein
VIMVRERDWRPTLHDFVHALQSTHADTTQSMGHCAVLHGSALLKGGHALPPYAAAVVTDLLRVCNPPPHVTLHGVHLPNALTSQSTAQ